MYQSPDKILDGEAREVINKMESLNEIDYQRLLMAERDGQDRLAVKQWLKNRGNIKEEDLEEMKEKEARIKRAMKEEGIDDLNISEVLKSGEDFGQFLSRLEDIYKKAERKSDSSSGDEDEKDITVSAFRNLTEKDLREMDYQEKRRWASIFDTDEVHGSGTDEEIQEELISKLNDLKERSEVEFFSPSDEGDQVKEKIENVSENLRRKHGGEVKESLDEEEEFLEKKTREKKEKIVEDNFDSEEGNYQKEAEKKHFDLDEEDSLEDFERRIESHKERLEESIEMMQNVIVGQEKVLERVMVAMMCEGHILMEGVPGLGKSLTVETLAQTVKDTDFNRIQFVPDMLPSDILGQRIYNQEKGEFYTNKGPVFTNFLLADEINRAPPKTQAAMMEVMQEAKVSIEKEEYKLDPPYLVLATQNPLEQKGTYPLPEAVIDRFFMKIDLDYPTPEEEVEIMQVSTLSSLNPMKDLREVLSSDEILEIQDDVKKVHVSNKVQKYIVEIVTTARGELENDIELMDYVDYGPGPRASIWLYLGACAYAILDGRKYALPDDVKKVAKPVLRHRILLNYEGKISDYEVDDVTEEIIDKIDAI